MTDLAQRIRERLDGFAPAPLPDDTHALFAYTTFSELSEEDSERWAEAFQQTVGDELSWGKLIRLPSAPKFYPGFEQMRAALLAEIAYVLPTDQKAVAEVTLRVFDVLERLGWAKKEGSADG